MNTETNTALDAVKTYTAYMLAEQDMAGCGIPENSESAGAAFLCGVRDTVVWAVEKDGLDLTDEDARDRTVHEIADDAPSVYTHAMWAQFIDLCAYCEDPSEYGPIESMDKAAAVCLYMIAERLCRQLFDILAEDVEDDEDEDA